jgi:hypothetical protein
LFPLRNFSNNKFVDRRSAFQWTVSTEGKD